jgi:hypothetical protein
MLASLSETDRAAVLARFGSPKKGKAEGGGR